MLLDRSVSATIVLLPRNSLPALLEQGANSEAATGPALPSRNIDIDLSQTLETAQGQDPRVQTRPLVPQSGGDGLGHPPRSFPGCSSIIERGRHSRWTTQFAVVASTSPKMTTEVNGRSKEFLGTNRSSDPQLYPRVRHTVDSISINRPARGALSLLRRSSPLLPTTSRFGRAPFGLVPPCRRGSSWGRSRTSLSGSVAPTDSSDR